MTCRKRKLPAKNENFQVGKGKYADGERRFVTVDLWGLICD